MNVSYEDLIEIERLYYSLLVSVRMYQKDELTNSVCNLNCHIDTWLQAAKDKGIFCVFVFHDIEWLIDENKKRTPDVFFENAEYIFNQCSDALNRFRLG